MRKISVRLLWVPSELLEVLNSEVLFLSFLPFTFRPYVNAWCWAVFPVFWRNIHFSMKGMPCPLDNKQLIFKGFGAAPFVSWMKTEIPLESNHDPVVFICAQMGRGNRARFNSVNRRWHVRKTARGANFTGSCTRYFRGCLSGGSAPMLLV